MLGSVLQYGACSITTATTRCEVSTRTSTTRQSFGLELNKLANRALEPLRYLVGGESILLYTSRNGELLSTSRSTASERSWVKTAIKLALVIPMTVIGVALKAMALVGKEVRDDIARAVSYQTTFRELQKANQRLSDDYVAIVKRIDDFNGYLEANGSKGVAIWDEKETIDRFDAIFQQSIQNMNVLQQELTRLSGDDSNKMADLLLHACRDAKDPIFSYCFFHATIWDVYDYCRNLVVVDTYFDIDDLRAHMELVRSKTTANRQKPFFTDHTPFSKWRALYQKQVAEWNILLQKKDSRGQSLADLLNEDHRAFFINGDDKPVENEDAFECHKRQVPQQIVPPLIRQKLN